MVDLAYVRAKAAQLGDGSHSTTTMEFVGKLVEYGIITSDTASVAPADRGVGVPADVVERMVAWLQSAVKGDNAGPSWHVSREMQAEARAIVAELPAEVDADEAEATTLSRQWSGVHQPAILAAIKRGRALADADAGRL